MAQAHKFNPMVDEINGNAMAFGVLLGLSDIVSERGGETVYISDNLMLAYPTKDKNNPQDFVRLVFDRLPKQKRSQRYIDRMHEVREHFNAKTMESEDIGLAYLWRLKTRHWYSRVKAEGVLKKAREKKGLTQQQVADEIGVSLRQYQRYEANEESPLGDLKLSIAEKLRELLEIKGYDF